MSGSARFHYELIRVRDWLSRLWWNVPFHRQWAYFLGQVPSWTSLSATWKIVVSYSNYLAFGAGPSSRTCFLNQKDSFVRGWLSLRKSRDSPCHSPLVPHISGTSECWKNLKSWEERVPYSDVLMSSWFLVLAYSSCWTWCFQTPPRQWHRILVKKARGKSFRCSAPLNEAAS